MKSIWSLIRCCLVLMCMQFLVLEAVKNVQIVVVIASYNNIKWYKQNLNSLMEQSNHYTNWRAIYVDDCSTDGTGDAVEAYVREKGFENKIFVVHNQARFGALCNIYYAIHLCNDDTVIVLYDGDDWFKHDRVLQRVAQEYENPDVWLTYGNFEYFPAQDIPGFCAPMPQQVIDSNSYRNHPWLTSHLRTCYAGLFKKININDLKYRNQFFPITWDLAIMFPMLEMAAGHISFIPDILYVYNYVNPISDFRKAPREQIILEFYIRQMARYKPINDYHNEKNAEVAA